MRTRAYAASVLAAVVAGAALHPLAAGAMPTGDDGSEPGVVQNTGAAAYAISIPTPPGAGGFQPNLALRYSSLSGDGPFGVGWSLRLSEIRRSTRFGAPTYDDDLDRFELDGVLLSKNSVDSDRYHTFVESFRRIEVTRDAGGAIESWIVRSPSGVEATYDFVVYRDPGSATGRARWLLSSLRDANGNRIDFAYDGATDPGVPYPVSVSYTRRGSPGSLVGEEKKIAFVYEARPDPTTSLLAGVRATMTRRVREIQVSVGASFVRRIRLTYSGSGTYATHRSRIVSSQLFGDDCQGSIGLCQGLPAESYEYTDPGGTNPGDPLSGPGAQWTSFGQVPPEPIEEAQGSGSRDLGWRVGDIDGNGMPDLVQIYEGDGRAPVVRVYLNLKDPTWGLNFWQRDTAWENKLLQVSFANPHVIVSGSSSDVTNVTADPASGFDLSRMYFSQKRDWRNGIAPSKWLSPVHARLEDVNGDGLADLVAAFVTGAAQINCPSARPRPATT